MTGIEYRNDIATHNSEQDATQSTAHNLGSIVTRFCVQLAEKQTVEPTAALLAAGEELRMAINHTLRSIRDSADSLQSGYKVALQESINQQRAVEAAPRKLKGQPPTNTIENEMSELNERLVRMECEQSYNNKTSVTHKEIELAARFWIQQRLLRFSTRHIHDISYGVRPYDVAQRNGDKEPPMAEIYLADLVDKNTVAVTPFMLPFDLSRHFIDKIKGSISLIRLPREQFAAIVSEELAKHTGSEAGRELMDHLRVFERYDPDFKRVICGLGFYASSKDNQDA